MQKFGSHGQWSRREDDRLLRGNGTFVDNIAPSDALYACFFRSPFAHAKIVALNLSDARNQQGVHLVLDADDLHAAGISKGLSSEVVECPDGTQGTAPRRSLLAERKVRFVGEPIALVVATTLQLAKDACEAIEFEHEELPAHMCLSEGGEPIHREAPNNCAFTWSAGDDTATHSAFSQAAHRVSKTVRNHRVTVNSLEPRGCFAEPAGEGVHLAFNGQGVQDLKDSISDILGMKADHIRVTTPDVGGGFGMKAMSYPEPLLLAHAVRVLDHPVRWMSERVEAMLTDTGARDLEHDAELAFDENYRLLGYRVDTRFNLGAYNSDLGQLIQTDYFAMVLSGAYRTPTCHLSATGIYTNTAQTDAYRGAGRAEAIYVLERMMDYAARELGVDPWELRRRNFIQPDQFPYVTPMGEEYDPANYDQVLNQAEDMADVSGFAKRRAASEAKGCLRGIGLSYYVMNAIGNEKISTHLQFLNDGRVIFSVPSQSAGQGHESAYAQFLSDQSGIPEDRIVVVQGDSDKTGSGVGTGGSSSITTVGNAALATIANVVETFHPFVVEHLQVAPDTVEFGGGSFRASGSNLTLSMLEAAEIMRTVGEADLLRIEGIGIIENWAFPNGAHVAEIELDPETGLATLERYSVVSDFGNLINPVLVEGQVHGGCAQGIGQALLERTVFDENGQLLSASFMDYAMPRADNLPMFKFMNEPVPSTANAMGVKGCGEAGTVGSVAAVANAVMDALWGQGVHTLDMPCTPERIWNVLHKHS
ncbi:Carbon monoxide dehydrogenase large chain [Roseovarius albus]|uniref:Carbon monoxide dehydrogenase large chain n=1 Tax=Roseovarius albus TaxID=1247867 RepID=A0A1X6Y5B9_9RHOB|nr:xanthine dehydrogenase family protein molybdopterin-binding subunit [Roseovarius albus]SLN10846.1 Carbon monoxide dehydrogenase large chain [Roseovarius albus]